MQYFKPDGDFFIGDCMPFFHSDTFRLFYLLDENHHGALGGLGGHQWAQASSKDLIHWKHHPLAIPITENREGSICTGSVIFHQVKYYGFYATRLRDWRQHLSLATSLDGVHFEKTTPNPLAIPPDGYDIFHYRDPFVYRDHTEGLFHMLVTARLVDWPVDDRSGCLAHLVSTDLIGWENREPFIIPGLPGVPECPDYFAWNGWYYLVFSIEGIARYRMSQKPFGPWQRPKVDTFDGPAARVMKTAPFLDDRRLGVVWIGTRRGDKDDGQFQFAGNAVFRELVQHDDGTLGAKFPDEMIPTGEPVHGLCPTALSKNVIIDGRRIRIASQTGLGVAECSSLPYNVRLVVHVYPEPNSAEFGFRFRAAESFDSGYDLHFISYERAVKLHHQWILGVDRLDQPFTLDIVLWDDIIDVCIDSRRTIIDRCPEQQGHKLFIYAQDAEVNFDILETIALL